MNILTGKLPHEAEISGERYALNTGFATGLRILEAYEDPELTSQERQMLMLKLLYRQLPEASEGVARALELGIRFLEGPSDPGKTPGNQGPRLYSFREDADLIFSGILSSHGVDLTREKDLHWWIFCALFREMREECAFCRLVALRKRLIQGKASREDRRLAAALGAAALPPAGIGMSPEENQRAAEFYRLLEEEWEGEEKDHG